MFPLFKASNLGNLLRVTSDSNLTFEQNINVLCHKASEKLHNYLKLSYLHI